MFQIARAARFNSSLAVQTECGGTAELSPAPGAPAAMGCTCGGLRACAAGWSGSASLPHALLSYSAWFMCKQRDQAPPSSPLSLSLPAGSSPLATACWPIGWVWSQRLGQGEACDWLTAPGHMQGLDGVHTGGWGCTMCTWFEDESFRNRFMLCTHVCGCVFHCNQRGK